MRITISSRKSDLARLQSFTVGEALQKAHPGLQIDYKFKESLGDINLHDPLWKIPEKGVFTEDFYKELLSGESDMIVHSWKDLPTELKPDTEIAATLPRADQRDLLLVKKSSLEKVKTTSVFKIYSSSPRRSYNLTPFLKEAFPFGVKTIEFESVRGNIPTRIRKLLESDETHGLIVAKAALDRLLVAPQDEFHEVQELLRGFLKQLEWMVLPLSVNPNAAAQGALAIEVRKDRTDIKSLLEKINSPDDFESTEMERKVLRSYGGGCHQKIGVSFLKKQYGMIHSLQGLTDSGQVLNQYTLITDRKAPQFSEQSLWSTSLAKQNYFSRTSIDVELQLEALFVSKAEAYSSKIKSNYTWTAGIQTWKNLASQGVWVHGCNDSLGESEIPPIDTLAQKNLQWTKITHTEAAKTETLLKSVGTYELHRNEVPFNFSGKKFFFWGSSSLFLAAVQEHPMILKEHHACGPGNTSLIITNYFKANNIQLDHLWIFLSEEDWRKNVTANL